MSSQAEKRRRRKVTTAIRTDENRAQFGAGITSKPRVIEARTPYQRRKDGLTWLSDKSKINRDQRSVGERYGAAYRAAKIEDPAAIKSAWPANDAGGGSFGSFGPPPADMLAASEWIYEARRQYAAAQNALGNHAGLVAACDAVCGKGMTPREISPVQSEAEQIECSLRIALDLLQRNWPEACR